MSFPLPSDRRQFLKAGALLSAASLLPTIGSAADEAKPIKVALVGCGGRGTGAAAQSLAVAGTTLVAMADAFADNLASSHKELVTKFGDRVDVYGYEIKPPAGPVTPAQALAKLRRSWALGVRHYWDLAQDHFETRDEPVNAAAFAGNENLPCYLNSELLN
jgi:hypothetical protein